MCCLDIDAEVEKKQEEEDQKSTKHGCNVIRYAS
jgi:hypothetical protein